VTVPVVDFFAGPGGLGEGFSAFANGSDTPFRIVLSVEKEAAAHSTLRLRAFVRRFDRGRIPPSYYRYVTGGANQPWDERTAGEWAVAENEALNAALGDPAGDAAVDHRLKALRLEGRPWILIGGPPCQAFSLVGRARNTGVAGYRAEDDERHFLYRNYLRVLDRLAPPVFVFENVKGILSSSIAGQEIFVRILSDLSRPAVALRGERARGVQYRIRALSTDTVLNPGDDPRDLDWRDFLVRAEEHGVPQARHRVILIGVRSDLDPMPRVAVKVRAAVRLADVIGGLPRIRSGLSDGDSLQDWRMHVLKGARSLRRSIEGAFDDLFGHEGSGAIDLHEGKLPNARSSTAAPSDTRLKAEHSWLYRWFRDNRLEATLNHESRTHMASDLHRYLFCAMFARLAGRSPKARDFPTHLAPDHESWGTGAFVDRFRVQVANSVASTITSHIAKDGHYFIHYDPHQCRSLTVREAARIQTFPDNYSFQGNRTQQYVQVGNAVPPLVALEIAGVVHKILEGA
jgi:DNA (cytosine-5)-methyltransferase 1